MYPYNTDVVNVSHSEYPQYVKELYSQLRLDFCCKFTHLSFNDKAFEQQFWYQLKLLLAPFTTSSTLVLFDLPTITKQRRSLLK